MSSVRALAGVCLALCLGLSQSARAGGEPALAQQPVPPLGIQQAQALAALPGWQRLLHIPKTGRVSEVLDADFFLAANGHEDATAELLATLAALQLAPSHDQDIARHARCRFPARQLWLGRQLGVAAWDRVDARCLNISRWMDLERLRSASVSLVSGYFGNPASSFGHALLRFDTGGTQASGGLNDVSINFGAMVPEHEAMPRYIVMGMLGGYQAGFSDKEFFEHDRVYARTENRDMWRYELALDDWQLRLLALHVWEIAGRKFTYYFLSENCAWRLAELLELVLPVSLRQGASEAWYIPVELFHRLEAAREQGLAAVRQVSFEPSAQRLLVNHVAQLRGQELASFERILAAPEAAPELALQGLTSTQSQRVIEVALDWINWKNPLGETAKRRDHAIETLKQNLLHTRLRLAPGAASLQPVQALISPALGTRPQRWAVGLQGQQGQFDPSLRWTGVAFDMNGFHRMSDGELRIADVRLARGPEQHIRLEGLTFISVRKLNLAGAQLPGEFDYAWQLNVGAEREDFAAPLRAQASAGLGKAWHSPRGGWVAYGFVDLEARGQPASLALVPDVGLLWAQGDWRAQARWRYRGQGQRSAQLELKRRVSTAMVLGLSLRQTRTQELALTAEFFR